MPKCKRCNSTISRLDSDICPFCGEKNPIDASYETMDMTSLINNEVIKESSLYKCKSKKIWVLLGFLAGFLGIDNFYIGKKKIAIIILASSLVLYVGLSCLLYFVVFKNFLGFIIPISILVAINLISGLHNLLVNSPKDAQGEFIR